MSTEAMTERFEMRLSASVLEQVDAWRGRQSDIPSRAEAIRRLIEVGLSASNETQVQLSDGDKLILLMLRDLFKQLKLKDGEIDPDFIAEVIFGGHSWGLKWQYSGIFHGHEDKRAVVSEVVDVLDMWSFLEAAHRKLSKADKARVATEAAPIGKHVQFGGFDGNEESEYGSVGDNYLDSSSGCGVC
ncbi:MAG: YfbU family protein [Acidobacteriia bacterium]|nr:YfbU family protein [Terriglobia bacterium]